MIRLRLGCYLYGAVVASENGDEWISSAELAVCANVDASQVRRDLGDVEGAGGVKGRGYPVAGLVEALTARLGNGDAAQSLAVTARDALLTAARARSASLWLREGGRIRQPTMGARGVV